jgi:hypothetical protein
MIRHISQYVIYCCLIRGPAAAGQYLGLNNMRLKGLEI